MSRRRPRKPRTGGHGLWAWTPDGITPTDVPDNPLRVDCPRCGAKAGARCRRPGRGGRATMAGYHPARTNLDPGDHP